MKTLLTNIKALLQEQLAGVVRPGDIFITEDERLLPDSVKFPAISIKDGDIDNQDDTSMGESSTLLVKVTVYAQILKVEASIMGAQGVLALEQAHIDEIKGNRALMPGCLRAWPVRQQESEIFGDEKQMIQAKTTTYQFER